MSLRTRLAVLLTSVLSTGCPNTDEAVFIEPTIQSPSAMISQSALVDAIGGSFVIGLHLGPRATDPSVVDLGQLSITSADRTTTLHAPLEVTTDPSFPVSVPVDGDVSVAVSFSPDDNALDEGAVDAICDPAGIVITGTLDDSLRGGSVPVASSAFPVGGCL